MGSLSAPSTKRSTALTTCGRRPSSTNCRPHCITHKPTNAQRSGPRDRSDVERGQWRRLGRASQPFCATERRGRLYVPRSCVGPWCRGGRSACSPATRHHRRNNSHHIRPKITKLATHKTSLTTPTHKPAPRPSPPLPPPNQECRLTSIQVQSPSIHMRALLPTARFHGNGSSPRSNRALPQTKANKHHVKQLPDVARSQCPMAPG